MTLSTYNGLSMVGGFGGGSVIFADQNGAPGGGSDDTASLQNLIDRCPSTSTTFIALGNATYSYTSLYWNKPVILGSLSPGPRNSSSGGGSKPELKCIATGSPVYGIKIGDKSNWASADATNLLRGAGFVGVRLNFNTKKFSTAALQIEGQQNAIWRDVQICYVGGTGASAQSRAVYSRVLFDSLFDHIQMLACYADASTGIWYMDDYYIDTTGNHNMLNFPNFHGEQCSGAYFKTNTNANVDCLRWTASKFECNGPTTSYGNHIFELGDANRCFIGDKTTFTGYLTTKGYSGITQITKGYGNTIRDVDYNTCDGLAFLSLGATAHLTRHKDATQNNATTLMTLSNASTYAHEIEYPASIGLVDALYGRGFATARKDHGYGGWVSVHRLGQTPNSCFKPRTGARNAEKSTFLRTDSTAQGSVLPNLPTQQYIDCPINKTLYALVRRTADGATASLQVNVNGSTVAGSALAALPAAVTTISFSGDGTTVTATKASHGFKTGDTLIITATSSYNSTAGAPVEIIVTSTSEFTFLAAGTGVESGTAQKCQWQAVTFALTTTHFAGLGEDSTDRFRLEYGASNSQTIEIDSIQFGP